jgi:Flp pilus assembly protein TadG
MKRIQLRGEHGGATVEFAIISIVLLTVVFGIIEFGILMFDKHVLTNASREGARAGIVMALTRVSDAEIEQIVEDYAQKFMVTFGTANNPNTNVTRTWLTKEPPKILEFGDELVVTVTYDFDFLVLSIVGLGPITLKAETRMRME